jgi:porphobilinogen synthase
VRALVRETALSAAHLVLPLFAVPGARREEPVSSMPGVRRLSPDLILRECEKAAALGVGGALLFGVPDVKTGDASGAWDMAGPVPEAIRLIKRDLPGFPVITDVCLCEYTENGHCGFIRDGRIDNDLTLPALARSALAHAGAGADFVAPSDMMDGRVGCLRDALDASGFAAVGILSYAVKYASAFYGPFREAAGSAPSSGDRKSHQMDPANLREAVLEARSDLEEGADMLMVKPAMWYLDVVRTLRDRFDEPIACYNVSGEYAAVKAAAANGWLDERRTVLEALLSMRRAGADLLITYHALDAAGWLRAEGKA